MIIATVRKLRERRPDLDIRILGLTSAQQELEKQGEPYVGFRHFLKADDTTAKKFGRKLANELGDSRVSDDESIAYLGLSYADLVSCYGEEGARQQYQRLGRQAFLPVGTLTRIVKALGPGLVIATSAPRAERAAILAARLCGVPSICMVDLFASSEIDWLRKDDFSDAVCVIAESVKRRVTSNGRNPEHVFVTGNPALDRLADISLLKMGEEFRGQAGWGDDFVVLFASQPEPAEDLISGEAGNVDLPYDVEEYLIKLFADREHSRLVVRRHPNQPAVSEGSTNERVSHSGSHDDLAKLLVAVDCVITFSSTVGLEAVLLRKPLIALQMSLTAKHVPYADMGMAVPVNTLEELTDVLCKIESGCVPNTGGIPSAGGAAAAVVTIAERLLAN